MNKKRLVLSYLLSDFFTAMLAWALFYLYRKSVVEQLPMPPVMQDSNFLLGIVILPTFWILCYYAYGLYRNLRRKSRLKEVSQMFIVSFLGVVFIFFTLLLDDQVDTYKDYYITFGALFLFHFILSAGLRFIITSRLNNKIHSGLIHFNTIIIGGNERALALLNEINTAKISDGYAVKGFVQVNGTDQNLSESVPCLGKVNDLNKVIVAENIEEVILAIETSEQDQISKILNILSDHEVAIKIIPDMYDILSGTVKMTNVLGAVLIDINTEIMPPWQRSVKRLIDVLFSTLALLVLTPLMILISMMVAAGSKGPVFYRQERIGYRGKPFHIIKFRTMYTDAEKAGPQLSSTDDPRITKTGKILRKTRLDELPQFLNVLMAEMSLVGPRPERRFFIDLITERAPHYKRLHQIKPGITSWGQVKYGYAENVDQMIERMRFDLLYLENMSLALDIKILFYTVLIMVQGRGK